MPDFKNGTHVNKHKCGNGDYERLRISAGPHRGEYVDILILEAKLGRKLLPGMTVEYKNGNSLDLVGTGQIAGDNLIEVTQSENTKLMWSRRGKRKKTNNNNQSQSNASGAGQAIQCDVRNSQGRARGAAQ